MTVAAVTPAVYSNSLPLPGASSFFPFSSLYTFLYRATSRDDAWRDDGTKARCHGRRRDRKTGKGEKKEETKERNYTRKRIIRYRRSDCRHHRLPPVSSSLSPYPPTERGYQREQGRQENEFRSAPRLDFGLDFRAASLTSDCPTKSINLQAFSNPEKVFELGMKRLIS